MWKRLMDPYAVTNVVTRAQLLTRLSKLSYRSQVMSDYIDNFEEIFNRLAGMEASMTEDMQVEIFMASFGDKGRFTYGQVIASFQTIEENISWEVVTYRMLQEYEEKTLQLRNSDRVRSSSCGHALQSRSYQRTMVLPEISVTQIGNVMLADKRDI